MNEQTIDQLVRIVDWLAMPLVYFILLILFLLLFVKPFFAYLFDPKRVSLQYSLEKKQKNNEALQKLNEIVDADDLTVDPDEDIPDILTDEERIARLSASDPERAGQLVKQWLHADEYGEKEGDSGRN